MTRKPVVIELMAFMLRRWGRWTEILQTNDFRDGWKESDIEDLARVIVLHCLRLSTGDEKTRLFAWDVVHPENVPQEMAGPPRDTLNESKWHEGRREVNM